MLSSWRRVGGALWPLRSLVPGSWSQGRGASSHSENTNTFVREVCLRGLQRRAGLVVGCVWCLGFGVWRGICWAGAEGGLERT